MLKCIMGNVACGPLTVAFKQKESTLTRDYIHVFSLLKHC